MAESLVPVWLVRHFTGDKLLQFQFLFYDFVQLGGTALPVIRLCILDFDFMQLLAMSRDGCACGSLGIGRLRWAAG
jgi:hypothetical protein